MTKVKDKNSNHAIDKKTNKQLFYLLSRTADILLNSPTGIQSWRSLQIIQTAKQLSSCIMEIKNYGIIPSRTESDQAMRYELIENHRKGDTGYSLKVSSSIHNKLKFFKKEPTPTEVLDYAFEDFGITRPDQATSLEAYLWYCLTLDYLYQPNVFSLATTTEKAIMLSMEYNVIKNSHEAIGYWTAKLPIKKTGRNNVQPMIDKKKANKDKLKKWLETMTPDQCRIKAQTELRIKDRTYLNYIRELNEEKNQKNRDAKTAFLRKNDVSAKS
jgi:hypothetical protein